MEIKLVLYCRTSQSLLLCRTLQRMVERAVPTHSYADMGTKDQILGLDRTSEVS
jgi:hypothetical protein